eukprot:8422563-Heterocapsa_arctica.AAC.1
MRRRSLRPRPMTLRPRPTIPAPMIVICGRPHRRCLDPLPSFSKESCSTETRGSKSSSELS